MKSSRHTTQSLKKQLEAKEQLSTPRKSVYDNLRPQTPVVTPVVDTQQEQFVDEQGYVDTELLNKKTCGFRSGSQASYCSCEPGNRITTQDGGNSSIPRGIFKISTA